jgi:pimeloyl-ACP methyl ester carboxylesterase
MVGASRSTQARGVSIRFADAGDADRHVVFLNGNFCVPSNWDVAADHLARNGCHVVVVDYICSQTPWGGRTVSGVADMVRDLMDALDLGQATLVGHSLGGIVALVMGLRYPERVRSLGLVATGATLAGHGSYRDLVAEVEHGPLSRERLWEIYRRFWARPPSRDAAREDLDYLQGAPEGAFGELLRSAAGFDLVAQLPFVRAPALICHGRLDSSRKIEHAVQLHEGLPDSHLVQFDAGHLVAVEDAGAFKEALLEFVHRTWAR